MASIPATHLLISLILITISSSTCSSSLIDDLTNLKPPPDYNATISNNCAQNPSLRYCNFSYTDLPDIFKSTIVANYLCTVSNNTNCPDSFEKIEFTNHRALAPLYLSLELFWKYCPLTIMSIDLSNCSLKGDFPSDILNCSQIHTLDVSFNSFTGEIPLENFTKLTSLTFLNLSYNHFIEMIEISDTQFFKRFNLSSFLHSGLLPDKHKYKFTFFLLLFGFPIFMVLMVGCLGFICFFRPDYLPSCVRRQYKFTPFMLKAATSGYSKENLVGKIGKLEIYMGTLRDGTEVRIEVYREKTSSEEYKKFVEECRVLVQLRHTNLVQVLGWCAHRGFRALITEWRGGETIDMWLSSSSPPWKKRLKVLKGVLQGMLNLQEQWPEVGFDVNTNNVLLAEDGEPLISKFRVGEGNSNGTNIYKFGVFLFEMVTSKQTKGFKRGKVGFVEWVRSHYHENIWIVIDDRLKKAGVTYEEAKHGIRLGLMCTDPSTEQHFSLLQMPEMINLVSSSSNKRKLHGERTEHRKTPVKPQIEMI